MIKQQIKNGIIHGISFVLVLLVAGVSYAQWESITSATSGGNLTSTMYNEIVDRLNSIDEKQLVSAWVSFSGTDCPSNICSIKDSYNVSSVTKLATGQYKINYSNVLNSGDYSVNVNASYGGPGVVTAKNYTQRPDISIDYSANNGSVYVGTSATA